MIRNILRRISLVLILMSALGICAFADFGPKPSVVVEFDGAENREYYVTLLADRASLGGPYAPITAEDSSEIEDSAVWNRFLSYEDPDGLVFVGEVQELKGDDAYEWSYYPPGRFRVLVYFPDSDTFAAGSEILEQYAFDSYYQVNFAKMLEPGEGYGATFPVARRYNLMWQVTAFLLRLAVTVVIESLLAVCFGFAGKRQLWLIFGVNCATQLAMNLLMLTQGAVEIFVFYVIQYALAEFAVILVEGLVYYLALPKLADPYYAEGKHPIVYAVVGNLASFILGYCLSNWFPMMFS